MAIDREKLKHENVMDVTEEQIAHVYAKAFMGIAEKSADGSGFVEEVGSIVEDVLAKHPQLEQTLRSELVSPEEKEKLLDSIFGGRASNEVLNFLKVLSRHGRLVVLRSIARILKKLDAERRGLVDVEVRVAIPLDAALEREIEAQLRKTLGGEPVLNIVVDPSLVAGMILRVGDKVLDASIHTQLEHARRAMIDHATEAIELHADRFLSSSA